MKLNYLIILLLIITGFQSQRDYGSQLYYDYEVELIPIVNETYAPVESIPMAVIVLKDTIGFDTVIVHKIFTLDNFWQPHELSHLTFREFQ